MATNAHVTTQAPPAKSNLQRDLIAAIATGQLAGLIMAVVMIIVFMMLGTAWYHPVQVIGSAAFGDRALPGTFYLPAFIAGLAIHQFVALLWSLVFGFLINKVPHTFSNVLVGGLATGMLAQVLGRVVFVPALMNALHGHNIWAENVPNGWSWAAHLVFGIAFLLFVPIRHQLPRRPGPGVRTDTVAHG